MNENPPKVLVVDDEPSIRRFLHTTLTAHGFDVSEATNGREALVTAAEQNPDVMVLDLGLPDIDGVEVTRRLREWSLLPVIIVTVRGSDTDKVQALDAGADDYVTKPFSTAELLARLRAALRRKARPATSVVFNSGTLRIDLLRRRVTVDEHEVQLTPKEYDLLRVLTGQAGKVVTHRQLLRDVWGARFDDEIHMLRVNMSNLRRKIEPDPARPHFILTEPGIGYRLRDSN